MIFGFVINILAVLLNIWIGSEYGFTIITYGCIALNSVIAGWCLGRAFITY